MGSSTPTPAEKELPPDWRPANHIDLARDQEAHALWCCLIGWETDAIGLDALKRTRWWRAHHATMATLVAYGLLDVARAMSGEPLGWRRTEKGRAWALQTSMSALNAGFVKVKDAPLWVLRYISEHEDGLAAGIGAERELARRSTKRVRR